MKATMNLSKLILVLGLLTGAGASAAGCSHPTPAAPQVAEDGAHLVGTWREFWGAPGETDVTYHDEYQVTFADGVAGVVSMSDHPDEIKSVTIDGHSLDLVIHTAFDVHYQLHLEADGNNLTGTATTPDKVVPIRWERVTP